MPRLAALALAAMLALPSAAPAAAFVAGQMAVAVGPTVASVSVDIERLTRLGLSTVPLRVSWPEATTDGPAVARYELQSRRDTDPWTNVTLPRPRTRSVLLRRAPWGVIQFRVRAVDETQTPGDWSESAPTWLSTPQEADEQVTLSPEWQLRDAAAAFGGSRAVTSAAGASISFNFSGRSVGWVARRGPAAGTAEVSLDGGPATIVDLYRARSIDRQLVYVAADLADGEHVLTITTTEAGANVYGDAFVVLGEPVTATLIGAGDIANCNVTSDSDTAALAEALEGIVFTAGDNVYPYGAPEHFQNCYDPSWGILKDRTRPTPGNHEYLNTPGATGYFDYFGAAAGPPGRGWYRYNVGTWRVYALNSECRPPTTACPEQLAWLEADLAAEPHRCTLAIWHRPRWGPSSSSDWPRVDPLWRLLVNSGADLVINGHNHMYTRYTPLDAEGAPDPGGLRHIVVGTGGAPLYDYQTVNPNTVVHDDASHGLLRLELAPGGYSWEFLPTQDGGFTDSGSDSCR